MAAAGLSTVLYLARRVASFIHGIITLLLFFIFAIRDGSLVKRITEKEKNELALAQAKLWDLSNHPNGLKHAFYALSNGVRLHYVTNAPVSDEPPKDGPSSVIIFLHGFPDSWAIWRSVLSSSTLRSRSALIALDLPGYGGSDGLEKYGATEVLGAVTEFVVGMRILYGVDREDVTQEPGKERPRVIIVGHDWGCIIGCRLAVEASQLADRFILSNGAHPPLLIANAERVVLSSSKMLTTFAHHPLSSRFILRKAISTVSPLLRQLIRSGYAFVFNLPLPLVDLAGSMGNFWFLRTCHRVAAGKDHPFEDHDAAEAMATSQGPGVYELKSATARQEAYPESVRKRASSGGFTEKIRYYRDGLFSTPWIKSLETLASLYAIGESPGLFDAEPKGAFKAKTTMVWGLMDRAIDYKIALLGIGEYMLRGSQVVALPRTGHWTPTEKAGSRAFETVIEWAAAGEEGNLGDMVGEVYEGAKLIVER